MKTKQVLFRAIRKFAPYWWKFKEGPCNERCQRDFFTASQDLTNSSWDLFQAKIFKEIQELGISRFRDSPTVVATMDPPMPELSRVILSLDAIKRRTLVKLGREYIRVGCGLRGTNYSFCSDSRVQKILTLFDLEKFLLSEQNRNVSEKKVSIEFIEFGGGLGQLAELVMRELRPQGYTIVDLPIVASLAKHYLHHQNLNFNIQFMKLDAFESTSNESLKVFVSSWALSEISLDERRKVESIMASCDLLYVEMQDYFDGIDNYDWISKFFVRHPEFSFTSRRAIGAMRSRTYQARRAVKLLNGH